MRWRTGYDLQQVVQAATEAPTSAPAAAVAAPGEAEAMDAIRQTFYASLADSLESNLQLGNVIATDRARGYLGAVALAIANVARTSVDAEGVHLSIVSNTSPRVLRPDNCPAPLRMVLGGLIGLRAPVQHLDATRLTALHRLLLAPIDGAFTAEREVLQLARQLSEMAAAVVGMPAFQQTASDVFEFLQAFAG